MIIQRPGNSLLKALLLSLPMALTAHIAPAQTTTEWVKGWYGGNYGDEARHVELDQHSNMITAGSYETGSMDLDPGPGTFYGPPVTRGTGFVVKLDSNGLFLWEKSFVSPSQPIGVYFGMSAMDLDSVGNIYLAITNQYGFDADPGPGTLTMPATGGGQVAVVKLDPQGNLLWAFQFGGYTTDYAKDIHVLPNGDFVLSGYFANTVDFDPGPGQSTAAVGTNGGSFYAKYTAAGAFVWLKTITSTVFGNYPGPIAVNAAGECYLSGSVRGTADIDPSPSILNVTATSQDDMYLIKIDSSGNLLWANFWGGALSQQIPNKMILDAQEDLIFTFMTHGNMDLDPGPAVVNYTMPFASDDGIIAKFTPGGQLLWHYAVNGATYDRINAIDIDGQDNIYFGHWFTGTHDFDPGPGTAILTAGNSGGTAYIGYLDASGALQDAWMVGDPDFSMVAAIAMRPNGTGYAAGDCGVTADFDPGPGVLNHGYPGAVSVYFWKWHPCLTARSSIAVTACDSFAWGGQTYLASGIYTQSFSSFGGCDSVAELQLTIGHTSTGTYLGSACDSLSVNGQTYTSSGIYTQFLTTAAGCDSTLMLNITIAQPSSGTIDSTACDSLTFNGMVYGSSGTYTQTLSNASGCDSVLTLNLIIEALDTTVLQAGSTLQAQASATTYQWLDCDNNLAAIPGATQSIFTSPITGNFAVVISNGTCTDTSGCHFVVGIDALPDRIPGLQIYPSPTSGSIHLHLPIGTAAFTVQVYNHLGQQLAAHQFQGPQATLQLPYPPGYYELRITAETGETWRKAVVVQR